jgi:hypothetical protein
MSPKVLETIEEVSAAVRCHVWGSSPHDSRVLRGCDFFFGGGGLQAVHKHSMHADGSMCERIMLETDIVPSLTNRGTLFLYKCNTFWSQLKTAG